MTTSTLYLGRSTQPRKKQTRWHSLPPLRRPLRPTAWQHRVRHWNGDACSRRRPRAIAHGDDAYAKNVEFKRPKPVHGSQL